MRAVRVGIGRSARKHRLGAERIRQALATAMLVREESGAAVYVGTDDRGVEIEPVVVADDRNEGGLTVIHAMPTAWRQR